VWLLRVEAAPEDAVGLERADVGFASFDAMHAALVEPNSEPVASLVDRRTAGQQRERLGRYAVARLLAVSI
jgi:hypothetical protein